MKVLMIVRDDYGNVVCQRIFPSASNDIMNYVRGWLTQGLSVTLEDEERFDEP